MRKLIEKIVAFFAIRKRGDNWVDHKGNMWGRVDHTRLEAYLASKTLTGCYGCISCSHCAACKQCSACHYCYGCTQCSQLWFSTVCTHCADGKFLDECVQVVGDRHQEGAMTTL